MVRAPALPRIVCAETCVHWKGVGVPPMTSHIVPGFPSMLALNRAMPPIDLPGCPRINTVLGVIGKVKLLRTRTCKRICAQGVRQSCKAPAFFFLLSNVWLYINCFNLTGFLRTFYALVFNLERLKSESSFWRVTIHFGACVKRDAEQ